MSMNHYTVEVVLLSPNTEREWREVIPFKSPFAAKYMARKYAECVDVEELDIVDQTTGEVITHYHSDKLIWDNEVPDAGAEFYAED